MSKITDLIKRKINEEASDAILKTDKKKLKLPTGNKTQVKLNPPIKENIKETVADKVGSVLTMPQQIRASLDPYGVLNDHNATSTMKDYAYQLIQLRTEGFIAEKFYNEKMENTTESPDPEEEEPEEDEEGLEEIFSESFLLERKKENLKARDVVSSNFNDIKQNKTITKPSVEKKRKTIFSDEEKAAARAKIAAKPASHMNIVNSLESASPEEHMLGREWYPHAHRITKMLAEHHGPDIEYHHQYKLRKNESPNVMHIAAGLMGLYSPQSDPYNQSLKASVSMMNKKGVGGKGNGYMASAGQANAADKIINGTPWEEVMGKNKIHHYTHLIEHGGNADNNKPHVAVDVHAMSVAHGVRFNGADYATHTPKSASKYKHYVDLYKAATEHYNAKHGTSYKPHEVQAITWLRQQRANKDSENEIGHDKTAMRMAHTKQKWEDHAKEIDLPSNEMNVSGYRKNSEPEIPKNSDEENEHAEYLRKIGFHDHTY